MFWTSLFVLSGAFIAYIVLGYPLLLGVLAKYGARPVHKSDAQKSVSVIICVHNGARFLRDKLNSVLALDYPAERMEILVVSDGSTDATPCIAREFAGRGVKLLEVPKGGKPAALNAGIPGLRGEILLLTDVRQRLDRESLRRLVECFGDPTVGVVSGELLIGKGESQEEADVGLYWRYESWIRKQLGSLDSIFGATGPFYAMRRDLAVRIPPQMLLDDVYLPMAAFFRGYRLIVEETALAYDYPTTLDTEFKRKVRTLAGNYQIIRAYPKLLGPGNRMWLHFVSYKLGRLAMPYALVALAASSLYLPGRWMALAAGGQALFYGLAAADRWVPQTFLLKPVSSPARTFVVMMAAAVCALSVFFVSPQSLWKETKIAPARQAGGY
jgi:biofilm PGA synthesis N-glycosyltransferase PgaC